MSHKHIDGLEAWRQASEAGKLLDQPAYPPGFRSGEVAVGDNGAVRAWGVQTDAEGHVLAFTEAAP